MARESLARAESDLEQARRRIHEFAPSTREYEQAEASLTLREIEQEFFTACSLARDLDAFSSRWGVPTDVIRQWGGLAKNPSPSCFRIVVQRGGETVAYSMPFKPHKAQAAEELMMRFRDTLVRHGWLVFSSGAEAAQPGDTVLAEA